MNNIIESVNWEKGCCLPIDEWIQLNGDAVFETPSLLRHVAPFPPKELMLIVGGLLNERDFASHGVAIFEALEKASPVRLCQFKKLLDFGCGCGRLARMFKGHPFKITGCDVDSRHVQWINENLGFMDAVLTGLRPPLPFSENEFDAVISISVFTHLNERSQDEFLKELWRITGRGGYLFITVHGARALERARKEKMVFDMLGIERSSLDKAAAQFENGEHSFIFQQNSHLTTKEGKACGFLKKKSTASNETNEYGIAFTPESYIKKQWIKWFEMVEIRHGAIHDFQDIIVLRPGKLK